MRIKRTIARGRVKLRKAAREREEKQIKKLQLERNKNLRQAEASLRLAQAKEDAKDARLRRTKAREKEGRTSIKLASSLKKSANKMFNDLGKSIMKSAKRSMPKRKRRITTKRK